MIKMVKTAAGGFKYITVTGELVPCCVTAATGEDRAKHLLAIFNRHESNLTEMVREYHSRIAWNLKNKGLAQNWPIFTTLERHISRHLRAADIRDT